MEQAENQSPKLLEHHSTLQDVTLPLTMYDADCTPYHSQASQRHQHSAASLQLLALLRLQNYSRLNKECQLTAEHLSRRIEDWIAQGYYHR